MKLRSEIKMQAKVALRANYGVCLGILVVSMLIMSVSTYLGPVCILIAGPLSLGMLCHFTMVFYGGTPEFSTMFQQGFGVNYARKLGGYLWMQLWIFLWSMLFVIPGIIKSFSYAVTPYILANYPDVPAKEALNLSKRITNGHKADLFVFYLSFLGWHLLSALTFGLLEIFYVGPYMSIATSGYLGEMVENAVRDGVVSAVEFSADHYTQR